MESVGALYILADVVDCFQISGQGLLIVPDQPVRDGISARDRGRAAAVRLPSGEQRPCAVALNLTRFNIPSSSDVNQRWRYVPVITGLTKDEVVPGSLLLVSDERWASIFGLTLAPPLERNSSELPPTPAAE